MKIKIKQYKTERVEIDSKDFELPETTEYYFETHVRRSIRMQPIFTTWQMERFNKPEELYAYDITCVYLSFECKIERFRISISDFDSKFKKPEFIEKFTSGYFDKRTEERFNTDLKEALNLIMK